MMHKKIPSIQRLTRTVGFTLGTVLAVLLSCTHVQAQIANAVTIQAAHIDPHASQSMILAAASAGARVVAVGARGNVILSDDAGNTYRQAKQVPVDFTLTGVWFVDAHDGWAVGHGGSILHTVDGGETWSLQRSDAQVDQPLYSVYFSDKQNGWVAGLWSLLLHTSDGGKIWNQIKLPVLEGQKRADLNLLRLFAGPQQELYIAAEQGTLYRSQDNGSNWQVLKTGSKASLWSGTVTLAHTLIVGGLGGKLLRSTDDGVNWQLVAIPTTGSITGLQTHAGVITASSLEGKLLQSHDDGMNWQVLSTASQALTALLINDAGQPLVYTKDGPQSLVK